MYEGGIWLLAVLCVAGTVWLIDRREGQSFVWTYTDRDKAERNRQQAIALEYGGAVAYPYVSTVWEQEVPA